MRKPFLIMLLIASILVVFGMGSLHAQWSNDPKINISISTDAYENESPRISSTSSGGSYISWYPSYLGQGSFIKLCYLDLNGNFVWNPNSLIINIPANNLSRSDFSLLTDNLDQATLAFIDNRFGDPDVTISKVSQSGQYLWGVGGITLVRPGHEESSPKLAVTQDNSILIVFQSTSSSEVKQKYEVVVKKLDSDGIDVWTNDIVISDSLKSYEDPEIILYPDGDIALIYYGLIRKSYNELIRELFISRFDSDGNQVWNGPVLARDSSFGFNTTSAQFSAYISKNNTIYIAWGDYRNDDLKNAYLQGINPEGREIYPSNGLKISSLKPKYQHSIQISGEDSDENIYVFWCEEYPWINNSPHYLTGQAISVTGALLWDTDGRIISSIAWPDEYSVLLDSDTLYALYETGPGPTGVGSKISEEIFNRNGDHLSGPILINDVFSWKFDLKQTSFVKNQSVIVWNDGPLPNGIIKVQNFHKSGEIGPLSVEIPEEPVFHKTTKVTYDETSHTVNCLGIYGVGKIAIFNSVGQLMHSLPCADSCTIPDLNSGIYYVHVLGRNSQILFCQKLLIF